MGKDLGTYHLKVEFHNERGFIQTINTGHRFSNGDSNQSPIGATLIKPNFDSEDYLIDNMVYMYTEGNYSCDCNLKLFIARAYNEDEPDDPDCTEDIKLKRLTLIRPDAKEEVIYE